MNINHDIKTPKIEEDIKNLIIQIESASSSSEQKIKKIGAMVLTGIAATAAFIFQGFYTVGGLKDKWFVMLPDYSMAKKAWTSQPVSLESAVTISQAFKKLIDDLEEEKNNISLVPSRYLFMSPTQEAKYKQLESIISHLKNLNINPTHLTSVINGKTIQRLFQFIKNLKNET